jgi:ParB-like chromosome segregation protein Spo0J
MNAENDWPASAVELWPIDRIRPYDKNPREHSPEQITMLAASMRDDGVTAPILVDEDGIIIAGHGRRLAALQNGFEKYPVIIANGWSETKKRAVRIKDNSLALLSTWDNALLDYELTELETDGFQLETLGLDDRELNRFLTNETRSAPNADEIEVTPEMIDAGTRMFRSVLAEIFSAMYSARPVAAVPAKRTGKAKRNGRSTPRAASRSASEAPASRGADSPQPDRIERSDATK